MYTVTISERGKPPVKLDFDKPEITIGRVRGNDIVLQKNNVSKRHAKLVVKDSQFIIIDQKSTNGTIVNARKITAPQVVREDDKVCIGDFILTFKHDDRPSAAPPSPPPPMAPPPRHGAPIESSSPGPMASPSDRARLGLGPSPRPAPMEPPLAPAAPPPLAAAAPASVAQPIPAPRPPPLTAPVPVAPGTPATLRPGGPHQMLAELGKPPSPQSVTAVARSQPRLPASSVEPQHRSTLAGFGGAGPAAAHSMGNAELLGDAAALSVARVSRPSGAAEVVLPAVTNPALERAQSRAIAAILKRVDTATLPNSYPPEAALTADYERQVDRVLDAVASEGALDGVDRKELRSLLTQELVGLGPLEAYLDDASITHIFLNGAKRIFVRQNGQNQPGGLSFSDPKTLDLVTRRLLAVGRRIDDCSSTLRLSDGTRIDVLLPPAAASGPAITVRKAPSQFRSLKQLIKDGNLSHQMAAFLRQAVDARRTLLVAGPPGSGKTELLRALGAGIEEGARIVSVEQTAVLQLPQQSALSLESADLGSGKVMEYALRLAPERLLVDDLSPDTAYGWIVSAAFAALGSIGCVNANGERDALSRLEAMAIPSTPRCSIRGVREQIARAVHFVGVLSAAPGAGNRLTKLVEIQGLELDNVRLQDVFSFQPGGDERGGAFHPTGHIPAFYEELRRGGVNTDLSIFKT